MIIETDTYDAEIAHKYFKGDCTRRILSLYLDIKIAADNDNFETRAILNILHNLSFSLFKIPFIS
jgi:hypothetical protein